MNLAGKFIVLDGPDGSGKGTQLDRVEQWVAQHGADPIRVRDPGSTEIGDRIRHLLLGYDLKTIAPRCETLLFMASRAQLVHEVIRPALERGQTVIGDRYISATYAYQGAAGFPFDEVIPLGRHSVGPTWPDLTLILDVPPEIGFERTGRTAAAARTKQQPGQGALFVDAQPDAMERRPLDYHRKVRQLFLQLPEVYPTPVEIIDAQREVDEVTAAIQEALARVFD